MGPWVVWEFDPPIGDTLLVTYDAPHRAGRPGGPERRGRRARRRTTPIVAEVDFTTRVLP